MSEGMTIVEWGTRIAWAGVRLACRGAWWAVRWVGRILRAVVVKSGRQAIKNRGRSRSEAAGGGSAFPEIGTVKVAANCPRCEGLTQTLPAVIDQGTQWVRDPVHGEIASRTDLVRQLAGPPIPTQTSKTATACGWGLSLAGIWVTWLVGGHEGLWGGGPWAWPVIDAVTWRILVADALVIGMGGWILWSQSRTRARRARWATVKTVFDGLRYCPFDHLVALPGATAMVAPGLAWPTAVRLEDEARTRQRQADSDERAAMKGSAKLREKDRSAVHAG